MKENAPVKKYLIINIGDVKYEIEVNEGDAAEIIQKRVDDAIGTGVIEFSNEKETESGWFDRRSKELLTPNCAVCRWKGDENYTNGFGMKLDAAYPVCHAQASKECSDVYNSEECKALFKPAELEKVDPQDEKPKLIIGDCQSCKCAGIYVWSDTFLCQSCDKRKR